MPPKKRRIKKRKKKRHSVLILFLIIAGIFLIIEEFGREDIPEKLLKLFKPGKKPEISLPEKALPKVSIIMDDLGPNKQKAIEVFHINSPITISILPLQTYSKWIAEEAHRLGRDIVAHIPMEATRPLKLGEGGLYTWMTDDEIAKTLNEDIRSIPHIIGVSSHMGSAFTQDERVMHAVIFELKKQGLFFLDSLTTPKSVGLKLAKAQRLKILKRDVFLDNADDLHEIEVQWKRLVKISRERGNAIALAHPRKNTLEFLKMTLKNNNEFTVVPISELAAE
jgi:polysaccharide deacetylase 2 family uncharacterized protein YibQ